MAKCRPHHWRAPNVGDDGLTCEVCGRFLSFLADITPNMRASILCAFSERRGDAAGEEFVAQFDAAHDDARERYVMPPMTIHKHASVQDRPDAPRYGLPKKKRTF